MLKFYVYAKLTISDTRGVVMAKEKKKLRRALVHVASQNVQIICPWCQRGVTATVSRHTKPKTVRCSKCRGVFRLEFNFRDRYRKRLDIIGEVFVLRNQSVNVKMIDVSTTGVGFQGSGIDKILPEGKIVRIRFQLPNVKETQVNAEIKIKFSDKDRCGAEFKEIGNEARKDIGFWLMP